VQEAIARVIPQPGTRVHLDIPDDLPPIHVDPQRIEVVLRNLIENAVKYSGEEEPIFIRARSLTDHIEVQVEDSGPGIPPEHWQRIFDSFYRVESGLTRTAAGAGLGLAICQGIILAHGGEIWLVPRDQGTCIAFTLPTIREAEPVP
jgi:two-component system sensor histidine kinase KdpD